jgi:hypothetical protein
VEGEEHPSPPPTHTTHAFFPYHASLYLAPRLDRLDNIVVCPCRRGPRQQQRLRLGSGDAKVRTLALERRTSTRTKVEPSRSIAAGRHRRDGDRYHRPPSIADDRCCRPQRRPVAWCRPVRYTPRPGRCSSKECCPQSARE